MKFEEEDLLKLYVNLVRTQAFDQFAIRLVMEGKLLCFYHPVMGGEAPGVGGCTFLRPDDVIALSIRGHGLAQLIGKGIDPKLSMAEHCGRTTGISKGLGGFHSECPDMGLYGMSGTLGSHLVLAVGWGLAAQMNGRDQVVVCFFGDGTSNRGSWHEAANMAALMKLPIIWVCENNGIAQYMPIKDAYPLDDLANLASPYGIPAVVVDGQDVVAVAEAVMAAVERAREGKGSAFVECKTARFGPHGMGNPNQVHGKDRDPKEIEEMKKRDAVVLYRNRLIKKGILTPEDVERIDKEAKIEVEEAERFIEESPIPDDPSVLDRALYAE